MKERVYVIVGPTASGKTAAAVELAKRMDGEVVSADSMQIYCDMNIGTAKPDQKEMQGVVHHMIDIVSPDAAYSVAMFQRGAFGWIRDIVKRGKTPIVVGGTGLYINSLTYRLDFTETAHDPEFRALLEKREPASLHRELAQADSEAALRIHPHDKKRIIRRLEILRHQKERGSYSFGVLNDDYDFIMSGLTMERALLYDRIERRVDQMMERGLLEEARSLFQKYGDAPASMQAIGYKEFIPYFMGSISLEEAVGLLKRNTRRYAKRQLTWFRRDQRIRWYDVQENGITATELAKQLSEQGRDKK